MPEPVGRLPRPVFQYTLDQIAMTLQIKEVNLRAKYLHFDNLTAGRPDRDLITAHNIAPLGESPEWRVTEIEFMRWLRRKGYRTAYDKLY